MKPVPLLRPEATAGEALAALDGQTARLDMANGRTADLVALMEACDLRAAQAKAQTQRGGLRIF